MLSSEAQTAINKMLIDREKNGHYALTEPLENQRKEWEDSAKEVCLPADLICQEQTIAEVTGERISLKAIPQGAKNQLILHFHGGGLNQGSAITHRKLGGLISRHTGIPVFIHNYSLAPEHPFPAALVDTVKVYQTLLKTYSPEMMVFGGDSSGASLLCSTLLYLKVQQIDLPKAVYLLSPQLDNCFTGETMLTNQKADHRVSLADLANCVEDYRGQKPVEDPLISPLYGDVTNFPPTFIQVGSSELLLSDATRFEQRLNQADVAVELDICPDMWHVFQSSGDKIPEAKEALERLAHFVNRKMR